MERKRMILVMVLMVTTLLAQVPQEKEVFETGTLMFLSKKFAVIDEGKIPLDKNAEIVDLNGTRVPIDFIKLPALCKFQTNFMRGELSDSLKIVKIIILRPVNPGKRRIKLKKKMY